MKITVPLRFAFSWIINLANLFNHITLMNNMKLMTWIHSRRDGLRLNLHVQGCWSLALILRSDFFLEGRLVRREFPCRHQWSITSFFLPSLFDMWHPLSPLYRGELAGDANGTINVSDTFLDYLTVNHVMMLSATEGITSQGGLAWTWSRDKSLSSLNACVVVQQRQKDRSLWPQLFQMELLVGRREA